MRVARRDLHLVVHVAEDRRLLSARRLPVTELAITVPTPTRARVVALDRARRVGVAAGADARHAPDRSNERRGVAVRRRPIADLTVTVVSPAIGVSRRRDRA